MKPQDGSYLVMVTTSDDRRAMVQVSKDFKVTALRRGGPPGGAGAPPANGTQS
jgi:hypothetical protein